MRKYLFLLAVFLYGCFQTADFEHGTEVMEVEKEEYENAEMTTYGNNYRGYLVKPMEEGQYPGVVLIHEWWGLNQNIKNEAHKLAKEGFVVLAVDLYNGNVADDPVKAREYSSKVRGNPDEAIKNMKAAVEFLRKDNNKVASMGWCFGGGMSLQLSLNEDVDATVIYYGNLETDEEKLSKIKWSVLGIFGEEDTGIPVESVSEFEKSLNNLEVENEIYIYEEVGHAFANPSNPGHDKEKTEDAWKKTVEFLNRNLKS